MYEYIIESDQCCHYFPFLYNCVFYIYLFIYLLWPSYFFCGFLFVDSFELFKIPIQSIYSAWKEPPDETHYTGWPNRCVKD